METEEAIVDVGIPVHRRTHYLVDAIESVLAQTVSRFRLTISEDGPATPEIGAVVAPYLGDPRVRLVSTGEHLGAARHMSRLVAAGDAPYFALLHDDDIWAETFLAHRIEILDENPECGFVFSPVRIIDGEGNEIERMPRTAALPRGIYEPSEILPRLVTENFVPSPSVVVRRDVYDRVGGAFDPEFVRIYDYELWLRLAASASVGVLDAYDASWRVHENQSTKSVADRQREFSLLLSHVQHNLADVPGYDLSDRDCRRILASWSLTNALDAAEQRAVRVSLTNVQAALEARPTSLFDPRVAIVLLSLPFGRAGRGFCTPYEAKYVAVRSTSTLRLEPSAASCREANPSEVRRPRVDREGCC